MKRRSLRERLTEYEENLRSIADQLQGIVEQVEAVRQDVNPGTHEMREGIKLYRLVADDIQKILGGQDLGVFIITGEVPTS